eukprot:Awhi_evm1s15335
MSQQESQPKDVKVAIIGGGVAGSTIAMRLSEIGVQTTIVEKGTGLVNGPPMCHLHAGGNLYPDISTAQCLKLLRQCLETARIYPNCINVRPTVITIPKVIKGEPLKLLPRLQILQKEYAKMCEENPLNKILGEPSNYYCLYEREDLEELAKRETPKNPKCNDDWLIPVAKEVDLDALKFPLVLVQEYGLSSLRISATADLALKSSPNCTMKMNTELVDLEELEKGWKVHCKDGQNGEMSSFEVDYVVNSSGYRTGSVDNMGDFKRQRFVELKAAYVTKWNGAGSVWPEVIFHGERGTPLGMRQLTPYPDGHYQLHGMTKNITLFNGGLVASSDTDAQPQLPEHLESKITVGWEKEELLERTHSAINHVAEFVPSFRSAVSGGKPLYGAQQIPGTDASERAASVSFEDAKRYARAEIVKGSGALDAANKICDKLRELKILVSAIDEHWTLEERFSSSLSLSEKAIQERADVIAVERNYPVSLARPYSYKSTPTNTSLFVQFKTPKSVISSVKADNVADSECDSDENARSDLDSDIDSNSDSDIVFSNTFTSTSKEIRPDSAPYVNTIAAVTPPVTPPGTPTTAKKAKSRPNSFAARPVSMGKIRMSWLKPNLVDGQTINTIFFGKVI